MLKRYLKNKVLHYLVKNLLKGVTLDEVLRSDGKGGIIIRGRKLSLEQADRIQVEAEYIQSSITMKLLFDDMEYLAQQTMFHKSTKYDDVLFGKVMLYVVDILKKKIANLAK